MKKIAVSIMSVALLSACNTTVVEEGEGQKPQDAKPIEQSQRNTLIVADNSKSLVSFVGSKGELASHEGKFEDVKFEMTLDQNAPTDLTKATIVATIDVNSMLTDSDGLTKHLKADDFFDAEGHPTATFISTDIQKKSGDMYTVTGNLTMKGVSKDITFDSEITDSYMSFDYDLDRTEFGIGPNDTGVKAIDAIVPVSATIVFE